MCSSIKVQVAIARNLVNAPKLYSFMLRDHQKLYSFANVGTCKSVGLLEHAKFHVCRSGHSHKYIYLPLNCNVYAYIQCALYDIYVSTYM